MFSFFKKHSPDEENTREFLAPDENFSDAEPLIRYFKSETGIDFDNKKEIIANKLAGFCRNRGIYDFVSCMERVRSNGDLKQALIDYLTVNETYFFREMKQIQELARTVKAGAGKVDILCAPASTGAEPYTIAIVFLEAGIPSSRFHIKGIDINSEAIAQARSGIYKERALHKMPPELVTRYFRQEESGYRLDDDIKRMVDFVQVNIFDDAFLKLGKFDVVFSRNLMIYFDYETKIKAKERFERMLKDENSRILFGHADMVHE